MVSNLSLATAAAGLMSSAVYAQNVTTKYVDVYARTTTISAACNSVCTPNASPVSYTVVVNSGTTTLVGANAPAGATAAAAVTSATATGASAAAAAAASVAASSSACGFQLAINGTTMLQQISDGQIQASSLGQISDGQVQANSGLTASSFTISNGMVYDQAGRICSISGQGQSQFQCNYVPTTGSTTTTFSLSGSDLAFNGNTQFYACLLGGANDGYNIYQSLTGAQSNCTPITLAAIGSTNCSTASASTSVDTPESTPVTSADQSESTPITSAATPESTLVNSADTTVSSVDEPESTSTATAVAPTATAVNPTATAVTPTATAVTPASTAVTPADSASSSAATTADTLPVQSSAASLPASTGGAANVSSRSVTALLVAAAFAFALI